LRKRLAAIIELSTHKFHTQFCWYAGFLSEIGKVQAKDKANHSTAQKSAINIKRGFSNKKTPPQRRWRWIISTKRGCQ